MDKCEEERRKGEKEEQKEKIENATTVSTMREGKDEKEKRREECVQGKILPGYDASDNYWPRLFLVLLFHPSRTKDQSWKFSIQRGGKMIIGNEIVPRVLSLPAGRVCRRKKKKKKRRRKKKDNHRRVSRINYLDRPRV